MVKTMSRLEMTVEWWLRVVLPGDQNLNRGHKNGYQKILIHQKWLKMTTRGQK